MERFSIIDDNGTRIISTTRVLFAIKVATAVAARLGHDVKILAEDAMSLAPESVVTVHPDGAMSDEMDARV